MRELTLLPLDLPGEAPRARELALPRSERWQPLCAGIQNLWEYDDQRFVFHHGRLLLRGKNESGKTKALELLFPFLLDANLAPQRLDPFGSTARPMRWNLVNGPQGHTVVGYVWLEFGRLEAGVPEYCTVGAGLRTRQGSTGVDSWYFVTSQRVDDDLHLAGPDRVPATQKKLEELVGSRGQVFDRGTHYRQVLNQKLFGLPEDQYAALLETLLQLRRPQLAKQLQVDELSRILTAGLPPLKKEYLDPLAEGFDRLDKERYEKELLQESLVVLRDFLGVYTQYLVLAAKARAQELTRADSAHQSARSELREKEAAHGAAEERRQELDDRLLAWEREREGAAGRIDTLKGSDAYREVQALDHWEHEAVQAEREARSAERELLRRREILAQRAAARQASARAAAEAQQLFFQALAAVRTLAHEAALGVENTVVEERLGARDFVAARAVLSGALEQRTTRLDALEGEAKNVRAAQRALEHADQRFRDEKERLRDAEEEASRKREALLGVENGYRVAVSGWLDALVELEAAVVAEALLDEDLDAMPKAARRAAVPRDDELRGQLTAATVARRVVTDRVDGLEQERRHLAAATHRVPPAPHWRPERQQRGGGAPFYLLCDFHGLEGSAAANLEAALEASGLLDAWVTPEGDVLSPDTFDALWVPSPQAGPTLADVLRPTPRDGVGADVVMRLLRSVALPDEGARPAVPAWVGLDGSWQLGPLRGRLQKQAPAFIGETAREQARQQRLAELEHALAALRAEGEGLDDVLRALANRRAALQDEVDRFPELAPVERARAAARAADQQVVEQRGHLTRHEGFVKAAAAAAASARHARDTAAATFGLTAWSEDPEELRRRTAAYRQAGSDLQSVARDWDREQRDHEGNEAREREGGVEADRAQEHCEDAGAAAQRSRVKVDTLRATLGATRDELLGALRREETEHARLVEALKGGRSEKSAVDQTVGGLRSALESAAERVAHTEENRKEAEGAFRKLALGRFLRAGKLAVEGDPAQWTYTDALLQARRVDGNTGALDCGSEARQKAENKVTDKHQGLLRSLPAERRVVPRRVHDVLTYESEFNGQTIDLPALTEHLGDEIATRERLLGEEERKLFESFLSGEANHHLRERLREATALVHRMNHQLASRSTSSGMQLRLAWGVTPDAPAGAAQALDLLLRSGHLLSQADEAALKHFLQQRLEAARNPESPGTLPDRMASVLDYRLWHAFTIEVRAAGQPKFKPLTKKDHAAGSGGQKAVLLHLPLFAAAAAFYQSASGRSPRLVALDEAFAGIDRETRGKLMGLLAEFDLDFVMTSHEEWGFYEELDGLSTYHLSRHRSLPGVHCDRFLWDGKTRRQVPA